MAELIQACSTELILKLTLTCPWRSLYLHVWGDEEHVCTHALVCAKKAFAKSTAAFILTHGSISSDLSIQKMNPLFLFPPWFLSLTPPLLHLSLSLYLIISSSPAVWLFPPVSNCAGDTMWSSNPPLGMPLIPTFPSPSKVRSLDRSPVVELRDIFWWKHPAPCSSFLLPVYVAAVSHRFRIDREAEDRRSSLPNTTLYIPHTPTEHLQKMLLLPKWTKLFFALWTFQMIFST